MHSKNEKENKIVYEDILDALKKETLVSNELVEVIDNLN